MSESTTPVVKINLRTCPFRIIKEGRLKGHSSVIPIQEQPLEIQLEEMGHMSIWKRQTFKWIKEDDGCICFVHPDIMNRPLTLKPDGTLLAHSGYKEIDLVDVDVIRCFDQPMSWVGGSEHYSAIIDGESFSYLPIMRMGISGVILDTQSMFEPAKQIGDYEVWVYRGDRANQQGKLVCLSQGVYATSYVLTFALCDEGTPQLGTILTCGDQKDAILLEGKLKCPHPSFEDLQTGISSKLIRLVHKGQVSRETILTNRFRYYTSQDGNREIPRGCYFQAEDRMFVVDRDICREIDLGE